jgi:hypothetical protein
MIHPLFARWLLIYFYLQLDGRVLSQLVSDEDDDDMDDNSV